MKKITLLLALLISITGFSQQTGEVAIFDNSGYQFHVILNGVVQNEKAESNVRIQSLLPSYYSCRVMANDNTFSLDKNIIVKSDTLITYRIINKRGKFKLRFYSEVPLNAAPASNNTQSVVSYHTEEVSTTVNSEPSSNTTHSTIATQQSQSPTNTSVEVDMSQNGVQGETINTTTVTTETNGSVESNTSVGSGDESISVSMSVGENGANINVQGTGLDGQEGVTMNTEVTGSETMTHSEQTITTTTTTSTTSSENWSSEGGVEPTDTNLDSGEDYANCFVGEDDFELFLRMVKQETFEDDKTKLTTDFVEKKCLSLEQVGTLIDQFDFSDNRMTIAKAAFNLCYETSDYYKLQEKFTFSDDKEELRNFINNQ